MSDREAEAWVKLIGWCIAATAVVLFVIWPMLLQLAFWDWLIECAWLAILLGLYLVVSVRKEEQQERAHNLALVEQGQGRQRRQRMLEGAAERQHAQAVARQQKKAPVQTWHGIYGEWTCDHRHSSQAGALQCAQEREHQVRNVQLDKLVGDIIELPGDYRRKAIDYAMTHLDLTDQRDLLLELNKRSSPPNS